MNNRIKMHRPRPKFKNTYKEEAREKIVNFLLTEASEIDISLSICQGCTENFDQQASTIRYYLRLAKSISGKTEEEIINLFDKVQGNLYAKKLKEQK